MGKKRSRDEEYHLHARISPRSSAWSTATQVWSKREAQIRGVIESTVGMYGDLQGIAGKALQEIYGLELPRIEAQVETVHQEIGAVATGRP
jgi:hypothetical protein